MGYLDHNHKLKKMTIIKKKISYLKEAMEIFKRENTKHSIKIISSS